MDIVFVRTKLQAYIVLHLIENKTISKNFIFVRHYWQNLHEDSSQVYSIYKQIEERSIKDISFIESRGTIQNVLLIFALSLLSVISRGNFYLACINFAPYALVKKLNPLLKINTFDDGSANIRPPNYSIYHREAPLTHNSSCKTIAINYLFPRGTTYFLRNNINKHFSIYKDQPNIVSSTKVQHLKIAWEKFITKDEEKLINSLNLPNKASILIGTDQYSNDVNVPVFLNESSNLNFDLVILHPRDLSRLSRLKSCHHFFSPAESIILFMYSKGLIEEIDLYHFNSSAKFFLNKEGINLINLEMNLKEFVKTLSDSRKLEENIVAFITTKAHHMTVKLIEDLYPLSRIIYVTSNAKLFLDLHPAQDYLIDSESDFNQFKSENFLRFDSALMPHKSNFFFQIISPALSIKKLYTYSSTESLDIKLFDKNNKFLSSSSFKVTAINDLVSNKYFTTNKTNDEIHNAIEIISLC